MSWIPGSAQTDCTFIRDVPVEVERWSSSDPFGDEEMIVKFPQFTALDTIGSGDWDWLVKWANIDLQRVHPDETTTTTLWEGVIKAWRRVHTENESYIELTCLGALYQLRLYRRAPGLNDSPEGLFAMMATQWDSLDSKPAMRTLPLDTEGSTTITTRTKGAWESDLEYVNNELVKAVESDGVTQWTIRHDRPRQPVLAQRDRTTVSWTVTAGQPGLEMEVEQDWESTPNVYYAESQDRAGSTVRPIVVGSDGLLRYHPFAFDTDVHSWSLNEATGSLNTSATTIDTTKVRIERYINAGEGINRTDLRELCARYKLREADPGWSGNARLKVGPEEAAQFGMRAGENMKVREWDGTGSTGTTFHLARVEHVKMETTYQANLTIDTKARDLLSLEEILRRNRDGKSPARQLRAGFASQITDDKSVPWDGHLSGWVPTARAWDGTSTVSLTANTWHVEKIVMSGGPQTIYNSFFQASTATQFGVYLFDWDIGFGNTNFANLPTNPFADGCWDTPPTGFIVGWGAYGQRAGYSPGLESENDPVTGVLNLTGPWELPSRRGSSSGSGSSSDAGGSPFVWVAFYALATCTIRGLFSIGG